MQKNNGFTTACSKPAIFLATILLAGSAMSQIKSHQDDEESKQVDLWQEVVLQLPAAPDTGALLPFTITPNTSQSFHIDPKALTVGTDGVVRYTLVAQSSAGASSISYEGIRCQSFEKKLYAFGRADGSWARAKRDEWQPIFKNAANRQHVTLAQDYFCRDGQVAGNAAKIIDRLRSRHPLPISGD
ncbi:MAG: hypothetical protein HHJ12_03835 [Glaciimonas sp.]|nr:hypothetical protein [Glaciimonas sp.]